MILQDRRGTCFDIVLGAGGNALATQLHIHFLPSEMHVLVTGSKMLQTCASIGGHKIDRSPSLSKVIPRYDAFFKSKKVPFGCTLRTGFSEIKGACVAYNRGRGR